MDNERKLKPCPFCGGNLKISDTGGIHHKCPGAKKDTVRVDSSRVDEFLKMWNHRPLEEKLAVYERFFDYLNPVSISNRIESYKGEDGIIHYADVWTASIGGISAHGKKAVDAMKNVLNKLDK